MSNVRAIENIKEAFLTCILKLFSVPSFIEIWESVASKIKKMSQIRYVRWGRCLSLLAPGNLPLSLLPPMSYYSWWWKRGFYEPH